METWKQLEEFFSSLTPVKNFCVTCFLGLISHVGVITSIIALIVLIFQFRVVYYAGKLKKMEYDKECKGKNNGPA